MPLTVSSGAKRCTRSGTRVCAGTTMTKPGSAVQRLQKRRAGPTADLHRVYFRLGDPLHNMHGRRIGRRH